MSRDYAAIYTSIWADPDWRKLTPRLQHGYLMFVTQPKLSPCGILDFSPKRLLRLAAGMDADYIESLVEDLCAGIRPFLLYDDETGELLVRSFVRHDQTIKMPNPSMAIARDFNAIVSDRLRNAVLVELRRHFKEHPKYKGWAGIESQDSGLMALIDTSTTLQPVKERVA